jgi:dihydroorotate dehydrogenase electron transfer subunit
MTKHICSAKVVGQYVLNATTKQIDLIVPEIARSAVPGQFVNVQVSTHTAPLLRRPLGVAAVNKQDGTISLIYRIIGEATKILADACTGDVLSVIGPLGHGFDLKAKKPLLIGGGLGLAPLLYLAAEMQGKKPAVLMGGRIADDLFWKDIYTDFCKEIFLTTDDGSMGTKGTVMALLPKLLQHGYDCAYVCGPVPMMKAVAEACAKAHVHCQVSLERYMACGLGACLSCSCGGVGKRLKVCTDGPVFWAEEVAEW